MPSATPKYHTMSLAQYNPLEVSQLLLKSLIKEFDQRIVLSREKQGKHI